MISGVHLSRSGRGYMSLVEDLINSVDDIVAEDLRIGKRYTAAKVTGKVGLAYSFGAAVNRDITGRKASMRLSELGLVTGERVKVINRMPHGPIEVEIKGTRVAVGNGLAKKIEVEE